LEPTGADLTLARRLNAGVDMAEIKRNITLTSQSAEELRRREFGAVQAALQAAGLPSEDFGRFVGSGHPAVFRASVFDYRRAVPVLLAIMPEVSHPDVLESIVRSLSTPHARPIAAVALHAQAGLRRQLSHDEALKLIRPLIGHPSEGVRPGAGYNLRKADRALRRKARIQSRWA
jgi:hypothetical protein